MKTRENPSPSRRKRLEKRESPPLQEGEHYEHYSEHQHPHSQPKHVSTYARIPNIYPALFLLSAAAGMCVPVRPGNAVVGPVRSDHTVAGPVGRTAPPQIGRGRRGCGPLVATTLPLGRERPAGPPGSRRGVPSPPRGSFWPSPFSFAAPRPADSDTPLPVPGRPPSRLSWESRGSPPPSWRRGPLGVESPRVSRSALSQAAGLPGGRFVHRRGYGVPQSAAIPVLLRQSPPLPHHGFRRPLARSTPRYGTEYSPRLTCVPHRPRQGSGQHAERFPR